MARAKFCNKKSHSGKFSSGGQYLRQKLLLTVLWDAIEYSVRMQPDLAHAHEYLVHENADVGVLPNAVLSVVEHSRSDQSEGRVSHL